MDTAKSARRKTLPQRVAAEIRAEMGRQEISNAALAELLGDVSEMWVSRKRRGVTPLTLADVERIAEVLEVPVNDLLVPGNKVDRLAYPQVADRSGPRSDRLMLATSRTVDHASPVHRAPSGASRADRTSLRRPTIRAYRHAGVTA